MPIRNPIAFKAINHIIADRSAGIFCARKGNVGPNIPINIPFIQKKRINKYRFEWLHTIDTQVVAKRIAFVWDNLTGLS